MDRDSRRPSRPLRRGTPARLSACAERLFGGDAGGRGGCTCFGSARRLRGPGRRSQHLGHANPGHVGPGSHRPARPAARQRRTPTTSPARRARLHHRHRHPQHAHASSRARVEPASTRSAMATGPTTATATARTWPAPSAAPLRRGEAGHAASGAGARLRRLRIDLGRHRRHRLGHREPRRSRPWPT